MHHSVAPNNAPSPSRPLVNEDRLFSKIRAFFATPDTVWDELAQNACRARAVNLTIEIDTTRASFVVTDDGDGIADPYTLICIAESDYTDPSVAAQDPAGMGFLHLLANVAQLTVTSKFGTLRLNTEKFFSDTQYRRGLLSHVESSPQLDRGTRIEATGATAVVGEVHRYIEEQIAAALEFYPLDIRIGVDKEPAPIKRFDLTAYDRHEIAPGCDFYAMRERYDDDFRVVWYGQKVHSYNVCTNWLIVTSGTPLTPRLPDRTSLVEDEKLNAIRQCIRRIQIERALCDHVREIRADGRTGEALQHLQGNVNDLTSEDWARIEYWRLSAIGHSNENDGVPTRVVSRSDTAKLPQWLFGTETARIYTGRGEKDLEEPSFTFPTSEVGHDDDFPGFFERDALSPPWLRDLPVIDEMRLELCNAQAVGPYLLYESASLVARTKADPEDHFPIELPWRPLALLNDDFVDQRCIWPKTDWRNAQLAAFSNFYSWDGDNDSYDTQENRYDEWCRDMRRDLALAMGDSDAAREHFRSDLEKLLRGHPGFVLDPSYPNPVIREVHDGPRTLTAIPDLPNDICSRADCERFYQTLREAGLTIDFSRYHYEPIRLINPTTGERLVVEKLCAKIQKLHRETWRFINDNTTDDDDDDGERKT